MTPDQWAQVKQIFQAALDLPASDRIDYARNAAAGNHEIFAEVESLLRAEESSGDFLSDVASNYVPGALADEDDAPDANLGRRIGPYQIVREIGAGGMGAVYLAERVDEFHQQGALKLMRRGMDSRAVVGRFRYERQILAGLDHPNIAKLLDGGATDDGRPYFVMEYVEGIPIDTYCADRDLDIPNRLRLFLQVCAAVQYAHQNLIVHRDLKPGNILVTQEGLPKLLDFGIAKLLGPENPSETVGLTQMGVRLMTPEYASPEQVRGLPVTTATDIYSLGVILYELLTGKPPYTFQTRSPLELEQVVGVKQPPRPSAAAPQQARRLTGDLDTIVLKALEKDPQRRYPSVEQFAGDIRRHIEGVPIQARPQTWRYRAGLFVRRNRVPVVAAALVVLSLAGGLVGTAWEAHVARREATRAERNFNDVRHLTQSFLFDFHDQIKDLPGSTAARNLVVQTAVDYLRRLRQEAAGNDALGREVAEAYLRLGDVQGNPYETNRGDTAAASDSYQQALAISEDLVRRNPSDSAARLYLARAHRALGEILPQRGDVAAAVPHFRGAIAALQSSKDPEARKELARGYEMLGDVLGHAGIANLGDAAGANDAYQKALAIHQAFGAHRGMAVLQMKIGDLDDDAGDEAGALRNYQAAAQSLDPGDTTPAARRLTGMIHRKTGLAYAALGRTAEALREYDVFAANLRGIMAADPNNHQARMDYTVGLKNHADLLSKTGDNAAALPIYREILDVLGPLSAAQPDNLVLRGRYCEMLIYVGDLLSKMRQAAEARRLYADGLKIAKQLADRPTATADETNDYVEYLIDCPIKELAKPTEALTYAKRAVELSHGTVGHYLDRLGLALFVAGDAREAVAAQEKALALIAPISTERQGAEERLHRYRAAIK